MSHTNYQTILGYGRFLIALTLLVGCAHQPQGGAAGSQMFLAVDWQGAQTKPMLTAALATQAKRDDLEHWMREDPELKRAAIISPEEAARVARKLATAEFQAAQISAPPGHMFQGYILLCKSTEGTRLYRIGFSQPTGHLLREISLELEPQSRAPLDDLIRRLPPRFRDESTRDTP